MKVERPVIYMQTVCDVCKRDINADESYYTMKAVPPKGMGFIATKRDLDVCEKCFEKLDTPNPPQQFALSASWACTASYLPWAK